MVSAIITVFVCIALLPAAIILSLLLAVSVVAVIGGFIHAFIK